MHRKAAARPGKLDPVDVAQLASFRYALRRFFHFSQTAAARAGLTARQYQALLAIRGASVDGRMTISGLAQNLLIRHHSAVGLVNRLAARDLVRRERIRGDRRKVAVRLTRPGELVLQELVLVHRHELQRVGPAIRKILEELAVRMKGRVGAGMAKGARFSRWTGPGEERRA